MMFLPGCRRLCGADANIHSTMPRSRACVTPLPRRAQSAASRKLRKRAAPTALASIGGVAP